MKDLNKMRNTSVQGLEDSILLNVSSPQIDLYRFIAILASFFIAIDELALKFVWTCAKDLE